MKRLLVIGATVFAFSMVAGRVSAQIRPSPIVGFFCETSQYDENGDGRLDKADLMAYLQRLQRLGCWETSAEGVCAQYDVNQDGRVDRQDMQVRIDYFYSCVRQPGVVPGGPAY
ncbi:MAG: EF-hand domain-containing protein [Anaerolineae bacterium]